MTLRLFGNIFGEHTVVLILASIVPFIVPLPIQFLGLIVGTLQAFIFLALGAIYLSAAVAVDEHHWGKFKVTSSKFKTGSLL